MRTELQGKVALVTGSAHRVGKAIALELARRGAHQVIHHNGSGEAAKQTAAEIQAYGVRTLLHQADLTQPDQIEGLFKAIQAEFGRLDLLVNSASVFDSGDLATMSIDVWQRSLTVNLTAPFLCTQQAVSMMQHNDGPAKGAIVNICDESALKGFVNFPQHSVAKAGLLMLTKVSARTFGPTIRVNAVIPGAVLRPDDYDLDRWNASVARVPLQRAGAADDVARAVAYLLEEDYLSGTVLTVDGGESLL